MGAVDFLSHRKQARRVPVVALPKKVGDACLFSPHLILPLLSTPIMSLANAVAGPSRVRTAQTALRAAASVRHQSTRPRRWLEPNPHQEAVENAAKAWKSAVVPDSRDPAVWHSNYLAWRQTVGQVYKVNVAPGRPYGKAVWLGEEVVSTPAPSARWGFC